MNLIPIIRKYFILVLLIVMLIGCVSHFFIFRFFIHYSTDKILLEYKEWIINYANQRNSVELDPSSTIQPPRMEKRQIAQHEMFEGNVFRDTLLYSEQTGDFRPYRQVYFTLKVDRDAYLLNVNQPSIESEDLIYVVVSSLFLLFGLFILFTYFVTYLIKRNIWKPFNRNLEKLQSYDVRANTTLELDATNVTEFERQNEVVTRMVKKINEDYENSRIFVEDASHEMQTPLSIIRSNLDLMIQSEDTMTTEQKRGMQTMRRAVMRLSRLNKSLLLLTKINNDQFRNEQEIDMKLLLSNYLEDVDELFVSKQIILSCDLSACVCIMNETLSEVLISNLLSNAIRHNIPQGGTVHVILSERSLSVTNSCEIAEHDNNLFNRLIHGHRSEESSGLGLNIVQSICEKSGFDVAYTYPQPTVFRIEVSFNQLDGTGQRADSETKMNKKKRKNDKN